MHEGPYLMHAYGYAQGEQWYAARRKHTLSARATVAKSWLENKQWKKAMFPPPKKKKKKINISREATNFKLEMDC